MMRGDGENGSREAGSEEGYSRCNRMAKRNHEEDELLRNGALGTRLRLGKSKCDLFGDCPRGSELVRKRH